MACSTMCPFPSTLRIMAEHKELLDWVSPRKQREIDNQAAFLNYLLERGDKPVEEEES